jgi:hypothetical protein
MAQHRMGPTRENCGHPAPAGRQERVTDRVDAAKDSMQPPRCEPAIDRPATEPERHELASRDHTVLSGRKIGDRVLVRAER